MLMKCIWLSRSDGKLEIVGRNRIRESNEPTRDQLDQTPNAQGISDFYRLIDVGEDKEVEWRRKLGILLQQCLGHLDTDKMPWILGHMPQNYRLYEHIKTNAAQSTTMGESTKGEDHGRSINDRQDTYLYGHPGGRRKRYRSPADFFNHLLWLIEDESGDPDNCTCKTCAPDDIQMLEEFPVAKYPYAMERAMRQVKLDDKAPANTGIKQGAGGKREPNVPQTTKVKIEQGPRQQSTVSTEPMVVIPKRTPSDSMLKAPSTGKAASLTTNIKALHMPSPVGAPFPNAIGKLVSHEQSEDAIYARYTYRPGEMVWFSRGESGAWGLALITMRSLFSDPRYPTQKKPKYLVQQLCHPFASFPLKIITDEKDLRPWLAWSPPLLTHEGLRQKGSNLTYNNVDWQATAKGTYGPGDREVDGSILCAKDVDPSFTPLHPMPQSPAYPNDKPYNALYLGGEKIWVGEPVRLRNEAQDVLVAHRIVENISTTPSEFSIVGDIFHFTTVNYTPSFRPPVYNNLSNTTPTPTPTTSSSRHTRQPSNSSSPQYLPRRLLQDLDFRNRHSQPCTNTTSYWKCVAVSTRVPIRDIRGRWYESSTLLRILDPENFEAKLSRGIIDDTAVFLHARSGAIPGTSPSTSSSSASGGGGGGGGEANINPAQQGRLVKDRVEAFGAAVPRGMTISKGDDGPKEQNMFPTNQEQIDGELAKRQQLVQQQVQQLLMKQQQQQQQAQVGGQGQHQHQQGLSAEGHAHGGSSSSNNGNGQGMGGGGGTAAAATDNDIAEFMNLDPMEDGYVQNF